MMGILTICLLGFHLHGPGTDSAKLFIEKHVARDTVSIKAMLDLGYKYEQVNADTALLLYQEVINASNAIHYVVGAAKGHHFMGIVFSDKGDYLNTIINYQAAISLYQQAGDPVGVASCNLNLGNAYYFQGILKESLTYYLKARTVFEERHDSARLVTLYTNLGNLYAKIREFDKSIVLQRKSLYVAEARHDSSQMAMACLNLGVTLLKQQKSDSAEFYFLRSLNISEALHDTNQEYVALNNLADIYKDNKDFNKALQYSLKALGKSRETKDPYNISSSILSTGLHYFNLGENRKALAFLKEGIDMSTTHKILENMANGYDWLSETEEKMGLFKESLADYKLAVIYFDSLGNEATFKEMGQIEGKYELETKIREKQLADEKVLQQQQQQRSRRDHIQYFLIVLVLVILFMAIKLIGNLKISEKFSHLSVLISILIFFEFVLLLVDPYVENFSGNIPVYKLLLNIVLAVMIFPVHEWLQKILSGKRMPA